MFIYIILFIQLYHVYMIFLIIKYPIIIIFKLCNEI